MVSARIPAAVYSVADAIIQSMALAIRPDTMLLANSMPMATRSYAATIGSRESFACIWVARFVKYVAAASPATPDQWSRRINVPVPTCDSTHVGNSPILATASPHS